ncbi:MAG: PAS domain S-box protein [Nitrospirae bacterium]|nr:PAS domain S-box protein [Nitrospirota bacterium]
MGKLNHSIYETIVRNMAEQVYVLDADINIVYLNPSAEKVTGCALDHIRGKRCYEIFGNNCFCKQACPAKKVISDGKPILRHENKLQTRDGLIMDVSVSVSPIYNNAIIDGVIMVMEDISALKDTERINITMLKELENEITIRKERESLLLRAERNWEDTFNAIPDLIMLLDDDHKILKMNEPMAKVLGIKPEDAVGKTCYNLVHKADVPLDGCPHNKLLEDGMEHKVEVYEKNMGGHILVSTSPLCNPNGKLIGSIHIARDMNDIKERDIQVREENEKTKAILSAIADGVTIQDREFKIIYQNQTLKDYFGEHTGEYCYHVYENKDEICDGCPVLQSFTDGCVHKSTRRVEIKDDTIIYFENTASPIRDAGGNVVACIETARDITDKKTLDIRLEQSHNRLLKILENMEAIVYVADMQTYEIIFANRYLKEVLNNNDLEGSICYKTLQSGQSSPCSFCINSKLIDERGTTAGVYTWEFQNTINKRWYYMQNRAIEWVDERVVHLQIATDITERKEIEEELKNLNINLERIVVEETQKRRQQEQMLIQQSKMASMGEMIGSIAHQWRQPLNAISLNIQDIKDAYEYGELNKEYIDNMVEISNEQVSFMAKTIDDFRNFFRPSKEKTVFNVVTSLKDILSMFTDIFEKSSIKMEIFYNNNDDLNCLGHPNEFKQVILNLINNSKDAIVMRRANDHEVCLKGSIKIDVKKEYQFIDITISDNGGGIPESIIDRVFEQYFTTKPSDIGTGVGLYMSKAIIETNMDGRLTVRNIEGGAEFKITMKDAM